MEWEEKPKQKKKDKGVQRRLMVLEWDIVLSFFFFFFRSPRSSPILFLFFFVGFVCSVSVSHVCVSVLCACGLVKGLQV